MITKEELEVLLEDSNERRNKYFEQRNDKNWGEINISISWENGIISILEHLLKRFVKEQDDA